MFRRRRGPTLSSQADADVDGGLLGVVVDFELSVQSHVKRSVDGGSVTTRDVQTCVPPASSETQTSDQDL